MQAQQPLNMNPQAQPEAPQELGANVEAAPTEDGNDIMHGLEAHLDSIPDQQKKYLADALMQAPELVITTLGIVNGPEVYEYFVNIYNTLNKQNSAAPQPSAEATMSPMSQPNPQAQMNPQPQAKATPTGPMGL